MQLVIFTGLEEMIACQRHSNGIVAGRKFRRLLALTMTLGASCGIPAIDDLCSRKKVSQLRHTAARIGGHDKGDLS
jgi:hypothetical protein